LTSLLLKLPVKEQLREAHTRTKLGCGATSSSILNPSELATTSSQFLHKRSQQNMIIRAFTMALQQGRPAYDTLALGTIQNTILDISLAFQEKGRSNPTKDNNLQLSFILQCQFRAFKNKDPKEKQQKATPTCVIAKIVKRKSTKLQCAILQLTILAFFFAMRS
jgi:hypothetical protein